MQREERTGRLLTYLRIGSGVLEDDVERYVQQVLKAAAGDVWAREAARGRVLGVGWRRDHPSWCFCVCSTKGRFDGAMNTQPREVKAILRLPQVAVGERWRTSFPRL